MPHSTSSKDPIHGCLAATIAVIGLGIIIGTVALISGRQDNPPAPAIATGAVNEPVPPPARQPEWMEVARWSGVGQKQTQPFSVGGQWGIAWQAEPVGRAGDFGIWVVDPASGRDIALAVNALGPASDRTMQYGAGSYFLRFEGTCRYAVTVYDLR